MGAVSVHDRLRSPAGSAVKGVNLLTKKADRLGMYTAQENSGADPPRCSQACDCAEDREQSFLKGFGLTCISKRYAQIYVNSTIFFTHNYIIISQT